MNIRLSSPFARIAFEAFILSALAFLLIEAFGRFAVGTLADTRLSVNRGMLLNPIEYLDDSPRLNARLAEVELADRDADLVRAETAALKATRLAPRNFRYHVILARVRVARRDLASAEESLLEAKRLAPANVSVRYELGNLLVREGKLAKALEEFRVAVAGARPTLGSTLDLVWRASGGNGDAVEYVTGADARSRTELSLFLLKHDQVDKSAAVFHEIDPGERLANPRSAEFLNALIAGRHFERARALWLEVTGQTDESIVNGSFESDIYQQFAQFDWMLSSSAYARVNTEIHTAHSGTRSLRIDFIGRDSPRLENEIRQLVLLKPGTRYRVDCFAKADDLAGEEGPLIVVTDATTQASLGESNPLGGQHSNWQQMTLDFVSPDSDSAVTPVYVCVKRKARNATYEAPSRATVWFDDFVIQEQIPKHDGKTSASG